MSKLRRKLVIIEVGYYFPGSDEAKTSCTLSNIAYLFDLIKAHCQGMGKHSDKQTSNVAKAGFFLIRKLFVFFNSCISDEKFQTWIQMPPDDI